MTGIIHFETFIITGILLNLTPGNDTIFILSRSMAEGRKVGIASVLGITTGSLIHTSMAAFGLSLIIAKSIILFNIIRYAGAAYLLYIGYKMLRSKTVLGEIDRTTHRSVNLLKVYRDAIITNVLNPKVALFFIAFLPQFIDPQAGHTVLSFFILGITFTTTGAAWCMILAYFAAWIAAKLKQNRKFTNYINKTCGLVLIGLGIKVAITGKK